MAAGTGGRGEDRDEEAKTVVCIEGPGCCSSYEDPLAPCSISVKPGKIFLGETYSLPPSDHRFYLIVSSPMMLLPSSTDLKKQVKGTAPRTTHSTCEITVLYENHNKSTKVPSLMARANTLFIHPVKTS